MRYKTTHYLQTIANHFIVERIFLNKTKKMWGWVVL